MKSFKEYNKLLEQESDHNDTEHKHNWVVKSIEGDKKIMKDTKTGKEKVIHKNENL